MFAIYSKFPNYYVMQYAVIPIQNKTFTSFGGPRWYLNDDTFIEEIRADDLSAIKTSADEQYSVSTNFKQKCLYFNDLKSTDEKLIQSLSNAARFSLNTFRSTDPLFLSTGFFFERKRKTKLVGALDLSSNRDDYHARKHAYKFRKSVSREKITSHYKLIVDAIKKNQTLIVTLERFNSALERKDIRDRILDISTALESLVSGESEISYRFALWNAAAVNSEDPLVEFKLLRLLYTARSAIVHGSDPLKKLAAIESDWDKIIDIAEKSINYFVFYLSQYDRDAWYTHLNSILLGSEAHMFARG